MAATKSATMAHHARLHYLGVVADPVDDAFPALPRAEGDAVRVLQWNVLADGLGSDGFLVADVLGHEDGETRVTPKAHLALVDRCAAIRRDAAAGVQSEALPPATAREKRNVEAVCDWDRRWQKILETVARLQPDVVTLQELDHMAEAQRALGALGYACSLGGESYLVEADLRGGLPDQTSYLEYLRSTRVAFAPPTPSTCRDIAVAARARAPSPPNPSDAEPDDDGCAVFWRSSSFSASAIDFICVSEDTEDKHVGALKVTLRRTADGALMNVLCAHLCSGSREAKEQRRLRQVQRHGAQGEPSLCGWLESSCREAPTLLCLDANASPSSSAGRDVRGEPRPNVWRVMRGIDGVRSVWDDDFTPSGSRVRGREGIVLTTNKMRGPLSNQKDKVGDHACGLIDHIFYGGGLGFNRHAWGPARFGSEAEARRHLLPSLAVPSDHMPVVVEMALPSPGRRSLLRPASPRVLALAAAVLVAGVVLARRARAAGGGGA